jgi:hypothetical protein
MEDYLYISNDTYLTENFCKEIIEKFEADPNKKIGRTGNDKTVSQIKKCTDLELNPNSEWKDIHGSLDRFIEKVLLEYHKYLTETKNLPVFLCTLKRTGYNIQRYEPGEKFDWHHDDSPEDKRIIAFIIYLNNLEKEAGGATEFMYGRSIQPSVGRVLFFPATWNFVHRGAEVKHGKKYIITGFIKEKLTSKALDNN